MKNVTKVMHAHKTLVAIVGGVAAVVLIIAAVAIYHSVAPSRLPGLGEYETFAHEFEGAGPFSPNYKVTLEIPGRPNPNFRLFSTPPYRSCLVLPGFVCTLMHDE